jgi:hypothetical protein
MPDDLAELLTMSCSVVKAAEITGDYGQVDLSWTSGTTTTAGIACLLQARTERETATGAVISDHVLYMKHSATPATLLVQGAEKTHRVLTVAKGGVTVDAGPFDITEVQDMAGQNEATRLKLKRVG